MNVTMERGERLLVILALVSATLGAYLRFSGIGSLPFSVDEYLYTRSVLSILDNGLPDFACGGYYTRGLLQQYLSALLILLSGQIEGSMRIVPILSNLFCLGGVYLLAQRISGRAVASIVVVLFSFSLWEIEISRFARMYAPFQALFIWQVWLCLKVSLDERRDLFSWMSLLSILAIVTYDGAIFVVAINAIPVFLKRDFSWRKFSYLLVILVAALAFIAIDWRHMGVGDLVFPSDIRAGLYPIPPPVNVPDLAFFMYLVRNGTSAMLMLLPLLTTLRGVRVVHGNGRLSVRARLVLILGLILPVFQQVGFALFLLLTVGLLGLFDGIPVGRHKRDLILTVVVNWFAWLIFWLAVGLQMGLSQGMPVGSALRSSLARLVKYPNFFDNWLYIWFHNIPVTTLFLSGLILASLCCVAVRKPPAYKNWLLLLGCIAVTCLLLGLLNLHYPVTRYTFFLFPLLLVLAFTGVEYLAHLLARDSSAFRYFLLLGLAALYVGVSEDYQAYHLTHLNSKEVVHRVIYPWNFRGHYINKFDYAGIANFVNEHLSADDQVISSVSAIDYYLERLDYRYLNFREYEFRNFYACGGQKEIWSNSSFLFRKSDLVATINAKRTGRSFFVINDNGEFCGLHKYAVKKSFDNSLILLDIPAPASVDKNDLGNCP